VFPPGTFFSDSEEFICTLLSLAIEFLILCCALLAQPKEPRNNTNKISKIVESIFTLHIKIILTHLQHELVKHTNDIHSEILKTHTESYARKTTFVLSMNVYTNVYKGWTATESQHSLLSFSHSFLTYLSVPMNLDKNIFYKKRGSSSLPSIYLLSLITLNCIQWPSSLNRIYIFIILSTIKSDIISCLHKGIDLDLPTLQRLITFNTN
jgi:hypothetical protein